MSTINLKKYATAVAYADLILAFASYVLPFIVRFCSSSSDCASLEKCEGDGLLLSVCELKNLHIEWGSECVKKNLEPVTKEISTLPFHARYLLILALLTINFLGLFWRGILLLKSVAIEDVTGLKIWTFIEFANILAMYGIVFNPWFLYFGSLKIYATFLIAYTIYKIGTILPITLHRILLLAKKEKKKKSQKQYARIYGNYDMSTYAQSEESKLSNYRHYAKPQLMTPEELKSKSYFGKPRLLTPVEFGSSLTIEETDIVAV